MSNINTLSPHYIKSVSPTVESATLQLWIYNGTRLSNDTTTWPAATLDNPNYELESTAVNGEVVFDISPLVKDYLSSAVGQQEHETENYWVDYRLKENTLQGTYLYSGTFWDGCDTNTANNFTLYYNGVDELIGAIIATGTRFYLDINLEQPYIPGVATTVQINKPPTDGGHGIATNQYTIDADGYITNQQSGCFSSGDVKDLTVGYAQYLGVINEISVSGTYPTTAEQLTAFEGYGYFEEGENPQNNGYNGDITQQIFTSEWNPDVYIHWSLNNIGKSSFVPGDKSNIDKNGFLRKVYATSGSPNEGFLQEIITDDNFLDNHSYIWWHFHLHGRGDVYDYPAFRVVAGGSNSPYDKRLVCYTGGIGGSIFRTELNQFADDEVVITNLGEISEYGTYYRVSIKVPIPDGCTQLNLRFHPSQYGAGGANVFANGVGTYQYIGKSYITREFTDQPLYAYYRLGGVTTDYEFTVEDDWVGLSTPTILLPEGKVARIPFVRNNQYDSASNSKGFGVKKLDGTWEYLTHPDLPATITATESSDVIIYEDFKDIEIFHSHERVYKFKYICEPKYTPYKLTFLNKYGALEDLWFFKNSKLQLNTTVEQYRSNIAASGTYNPRQHQYRTQYKQGKETITLNSGFYPEECNEAFRQLLLSTKVWLTVGGQPQPVIIKDSQFSYQNKLTEKNINYTVGIEFAYDKINNVR